MAVPVGTAIGTGDSILIVVTEAAPAKIQLYKQPLHFVSLHYITLCSEKQTQKFTLIATAYCGQYQYLYVL